MLRQLIESLKRSDRNRLVLGVLSVLAGCAVVAAIYNSPQFLWSEPPVWTLLIALALLAFLGRRVLPLASLFFLSGASSIIWSLTPANTLLNTLWETLYLAAFIVGQSVAGFVVLNAALLLMGLERTLLLDIFGLTQYFSGSAHYLAGAQALLFFPWCLSRAVRSKRPLVISTATVGSAVCLLLILNSGARAVYLPALLVLSIVITRLLWPKGARLKTAAISVVVAATVFVVALSLPGPTIQAPLQAKLQPSLGFLFTLSTEDASSLTPTAVTNVVREEGGAASRLKMWKQAAHTGLMNPLGTGAGSFRNTVHAFQQYPLVGFSSAHNIMLEVFATGGWLRLLLLITLLGATLLAGWRSNRWPIALGSAGLIGTMFFDVTYQMPAMMLIAFWSLGTSIGPWHREPREGPFEKMASIGRRIAPYLTALVVAVGGVTIAWWYWPCDGAECTMERHLGYRAETLSLASDLPPDAARIVARRAVELNPRSYWAWQLRAQYSQGEADGLLNARRIAQEFPLASPSLYEDWAMAALEAGEPVEAEAAILAGVEVFPPGLNPAGVPLGGRAASYGDWLRDAQRILEVARERQ